MMLPVTFATDLVKRLVNIKNENSNAKEFNKQQKLNKKINEFNSNRLNTFNNNFNWSGGFDDESDQTGIF